MERKYGQFLLVATCRIDQCNSNISTPFNVVKVFVYKCLRLFYQQFLPLLGIIMLIIYYTVTQISLSRTYCPYIPRGLFEIGAWQETLRMSHDPAKIHH